MAIAITGRKFYTSWDLAQPFQLSIGAINLCINWQHSHHILTVCLGPVNVSLLEGWPHFRGEFVLKSMPEYTFQGSWLEEFLYNIAHLHCVRNQPFPPCRMLSLLLHSSQSNASTIKWWKCIWDMHDKIDLGLTDLVSISLASYNTICMAVIIYNTRSTHRNSVFCVIGGNGAAP